MKIAVAVLVVLGLVAAACAMFLVKVVAVARQTTAMAAEAEIEVMTAARNLPAMSVVEAGAVVAKRVTRAQAPEGTLSSPIQVVGRILTVPVVEGKAFRTSDFAHEGGGIHLATALPPGKRALSISLQDYSGMAGLLYPGCVVDVLVSLRQGGTEANRARAASTTLLQGIQVLAIGSQSVASETYKDKTPGALSAQQVNTRMVTLLVSPKQAQILQLAMQNAIISLSMRNPMDTSPIATGATRLNELSLPMDMETPGETPSPMLVGSFWSWLLPRPNSEAPTTQPAPSPLKQPALAPVLRTASAVLPSWQMLIFRGTAMETRSFQLSDSENRAMTGVVQK